jgi:hypothetical protein
MPILVEYWEIQPIDLIEMCDGDGCGARPKDLSRFAARH